MKIKCKVIDKNKCFEGLMEELRLWLEEDGNEVLDVINIQFVKSNSNIDYNKLYIYYKTLN